MSSGFLSKMFKQEIPTNAIEFDCAVFGMQSFKIHNPLRWLQETQGTYLKGEKKRHKTSYYSKKMYDVIVNKGP
jgi:hypothetical protein